MTRTTSRTADITWSTQSKIPGTPHATLARLYRTMLSRRPTCEKAAEYYDGVHPLLFAGEKFLDAFGGLFRAFSDNWCETVVNACAERLTVNGFRVDDEVDADKDAKRIWEDNEMDLQSATAHLDGLTQGAFYSTVWQRDAGGDVPEITLESAMSSIVEYHPKFRNRVTAGLRCHVTDDGYEHAELFLPSEVYLFRSRSKRSGALSPNGAWTIEDQLDVAKSLTTDGSMVNPFGEVPMVEFLNRPRLYVARRVGWAAHSEIRNVMPLQDAVNKLLADALVGSEFTSFPQRWLTGYQADENPETHERIPPKFESGPGKLWWLEDPEAKFGTFGTTDLAGLVALIGMVIQHIAAQSRTPQHYLNSGADRLSGESLKSAETGLVKKCKGKGQVWAASYERTMRLAGKIAKVPALANATSMETVWADMETRSEAEHVDAVMKKKALDVPSPQLWEELGYGPEIVARFPAMRAQMELEGLAAGEAQTMTRGRDVPVDV